MSGRRVPRVQVYRNRYGMWIVRCSCFVHMGVPADFFIWSNAIYYADTIARRHR